MSTCQSRFVSPGAANANDFEPSPWSSQPAVRATFAARLARAAVDTMPEVPFQDPSPRPASSADTSAVLDRPPATVTNPLPTSIRPPAAGSRPPSVADKPSRIRSMPSASTRTVPDANALSPATTSCPPRMDVGPEGPLEPDSTKTPAPVFSKPAVATSGNEIAAVPPPSTSSWLRASVDPERVTRPVAPSSRIVLPRNSIPSAAETSPVTRTTDAADGNTARRWGVQVLAEPLPIVQPLEAADQVPVLPSDQASDGSPMRNTLPPYETT